MTATVTVPAPPRRFCLKLFGDVLTVNEVYGMSHWSQRAKAVKAWRDRAAEQGIDAAKEWLDYYRHQVPVRVEVMPFTPSYPRQDVGACYPTAKAVIDGLVDCWLIPDDSSKWLRSILCLPEARIESMPERGIWITVVDASAPVIS